MGLPTRSNGVIIASTKSVPRSRVRRKASGSRAPVSRWRWDQSSQRLRQRAVASLGATSPREILSHVLLTTGNSATAANSALRSRRVSNWLSAVKKVNFNVFPQTSLSQFVSTASRPGFIHLLSRQVISATGRWLSRRLQRRASSSETAGFQFTQAGHASTTRSRHRFHS